MCKSLKEIEIIQIVSKLNFCEFLSFTEACTNRKFEMMKTLSTVFSCEKLNCSAKHHGKILGFDCILSIKTTC